MGDVRQWNRNKPKNQLVGLPPPHLFPCLSTSWPKRTRRKQAYGPGQRCNHGKRPISVAASRSHLPGLAIALQPIGATTHGVLTPWRCRGLRHCLSRAEEQSNCALAQLPYPPNWESQTLLDYRRHQLPPCWDGENPPQSRSCQPRLTTRCARISSAVEADQSETEIAAGSKFPASNLHRVRFGTKPTG